MILQWSLNHASSETKDGEKGLKCTTGILQSILYSRLYFRLGTIVRFIITEQSRVGMKIWICSGANVLSGEGAKHVN